MQLGELQSQYQRFVDRNVDVVAISVDPPEHSRIMIKRLGLDFPVLSDSDQATQKAFGVQNPDTLELALHAVFVINEEREVVYRKIAGRRPLSQELLDAIDHARGQYPLGDAAPERGDIPVAFPRNNFQALLEISTASSLPEGIESQELEPVLALRRSGALDDATIAYRKFVAKRSQTHSETELLGAAAWLSKEVMQLPTEAIITGQALSKALTEERNLRTADQVNPDALKQVQKELEQLRSVIRRNAPKWRLRGAKSSLRGYRELTKAAFSQPMTR